MKVAYIHVSSNASDGSSKALVMMLRGLMQKGVQPLVVLPATGELYHQLQSMGVSCFTIPYRMNIYPKYRTLTDCFLFLPRIMVHQFLNLKAVRMLVRTFKKERVDLVHSNVGVLDVGFRVAKKLHIPHIFHIREYADLDFGMRYFPCKSLFRHRLKSPDCYSICITRDIQRYHGQAHTPHSRVIYDSVFLRKDMMPQNQERGYFLFAGRIQAAKGLDQLLKAYKSYCVQSPPPLPLKVAGGVVDEGYNQEQLRYIRDNGLQDYIEFLGISNELSQLMLHARAIIIPSRREGFGFCMPEAMQQGCLVIARNTGGTKEQLDNGLQLMGEEIALRYDTVEQLANLLLLVSNTPIGGYQHMREIAFKTVNQLYSLENNVQQVFDTYQTIIKKQ